MLLRSCVRMRTSAIVAAQLWVTNALCCAVVVVAAPPGRGHRSLLLPMLQSRCFAVELRSCAITSDTWCHDALHSGKPVGRPHYCCQPPCVVHVQALVRMTRHLRHAHASTVCLCCCLALLLCLVRLRNHLLLSSPDTSSPALLVGLPSASLLLLGVEAALSPLTTAPRFKRLAGVTRVGACVILSPWSSPRASNAAAVDVDTPLNAAPLLHACFYSSALCVAWLHRAALVRGRDCPPYCRHRLWHGCGRDQCLPHCCPACWPPCSPPR